MKVFFHPSALGDARDIVAELEKESAHAVAQFLMNLDTTGPLMAEHPEFGAPVGEFHRWTFGMSPYHVLYREQPERGEIWILAIHPPSRHSRYPLTARHPES